MYGSSFIFLLHVHDMLLNTILEQPICDNLQSMQQAAWWPINKDVNSWALRGSDAFTYSTLTYTKSRLLTDTFTLPTPLTFLNNMSLWKSNCGQMSLRRLSGGGGGGVYSYIQVLSDWLLLKSTLFQKKLVGHDLNIWIYTPPPPPPPPQWPL